MFAVCICVLLFDIVDIRYTFVYDLVGHDDFAALIMSILANMTLTHYGIS